MADLLIFNDRDELLQVLSNQAEGSSPFWRAKFRDVLNGASLLEFSTVADSEIEVGQQVAFEDKNGVFRLFKITSQEQAIGRDGAYIRYFGEDAVLDLERNVLPYFETLNGADLRGVLSQILEGQTRWQVGEIAPVGERNINLIQNSSLANISKILDTWKVELRPRIIVENGQISGRFLDLITRGKDTGLVLEVGHDVEGIAFRVETEHIRTLLHGFGAMGQNSERANFAEIESQSGDGFTKRRGETFVADENARALYGLMGSDGNRQHLKDVWNNSDYEDSRELMLATWAELQRRNHPHYQISIDMIDLGRLAGEDFSHRAIEVGDVVRLRDVETFSRPITVESRVMAYEYDLADETATRVELGNHRNLYGNNRLEELEREVNHLSNRPQPPVSGNHIMTAVRPISGFRADGLFSSVALNWDAQELGVDFELHASQVQGFLPNASNRIYRGSSPGFLHAAARNQQWHYRVRAINARQEVSPWSAELTAQTARIISDDILFGEDVARELRELSEQHEIVGENTIDFAQIRSGAIGNVHIQNAAIARANLRDAIIGTAQIEDLAVTNAKIGNVGADKITFGAMHGDRIAVNTLNGDRISARTITAEQIASGSIQTGHMTVGDFNNFAQINRNEHFGWEHVTHHGGMTNYFRRTGQSLAREQAISQIFQVSGGETFRITGRIRTTLRSSSANPPTAGTVRNSPVGVQLHIRHADNSMTWPVSNRATATGTGASSGWIDINSTITLPATAREFRVFIQQDGWGNWSGNVDIQNIRVLRMADANLIVHGGITSEHLTTHNLTIRNYLFDGTAIGTHNDSDVIIRRGIAGNNQQRDRVRIGRDFIDLYTERNNTADNEDDLHGAWSTPNNSGRNVAGRLRLYGNRIQANNAHGNSGLVNIHLQPASRNFVNGGEVRCTYAVGFQGTSQQVYAPLRASRISIQGQTFNANQTSRTRNISRHFIIGQGSDIDTPVILANDINGNQRRDLWARRFRAGTPDTETANSELRSTWVGTNNNHNFHVSQNGRWRIGLETNGNIQFRGLGNTNHLTIANNGSVYGASIGTSATNGIHMNGVSLRRWGSTQNRIALNATTTNIRGNFGLNEYQSGNSVEIENNGAMGGTFNIGQSNRGSTSFNASVSPMRDRYRRIQTNMIGERANTLSTNGLRVNGVSGLTIIQRISSAERFKLALNRGMELDFAEKLLELEPATWFDRYNTEDYAEILTNFEPTGDPLLDEAYLENELRKESIERIHRVPGLVAEDLEKVGLDIYVGYDQYTGLAGGIAYDRLWTLLIPLVRDQRNRIMDLEQRALALETKIKELG